MAKYNLYIDGYEIAGSFPEPEAGKFIRAVGDTYEWNSGVLQEQEIIEVSTAGQTVFSLSNIPLNNDTVLMFINGIKQDLNNDYFVNAQTVTYAGSLTLLTTDDVEFWYVYVDAPLQVDDLALWWEGDFEGAETETSSPTVFTSIPNRGNLGGTFSSTSTARPTRGHIESANRLIPVVTFDDVDDYQVSSLEAADWVQAHQEWTWFIVVRPTGQGRILGNHAGGGTAAGMDILWNAYNDYIDVHIGNGSILVLSQPTSVGSVPINETTLVTVSYSDAAGYDIRINGVSDVSGALAGVTTSDEPSDTMYIGATVAAASPFGGQVLSVLGYNRVLSTAEIELVEAHFTAKYQRPDVPGQYAPTIWLRSDIGIEQRNISGGYVETWRDLSGNAHDCSQTTESSQPAYVPRDTDLGDKPGVDADGISDGFDLSSGIGWTAETNHTVIAVVNQRTLVDAGGGYLFDTNPGRLVFALENADSLIGYYDGAWHLVSPNKLGLQIVEFHLDNSGTGEVYRDGVYLGSDTYTAKAVGGAVGLMANNLVSGAYLDASLSEFIHRDSLLTGEDLSTVRDYLVNRYGFTWTPLAHPSHQSLIQPSAYRDVLIEGASFPSPIEFSAWTQTRCTATDSTSDVADPNGVYYASKVVEDSTASSTHTIHQVPYGVVDAFGWVELNWHEDSDRGVTISSDSLASYARFDATGSLVTTVGSCKGTGNASSVSTGGGWYLLRARILPNASGTDDRVTLFMNNGTTETYNGDGASAMYLYNAWYDQSEAYLPHPFDLDNVGWSKSNLTETGGQSDPDGGTNAWCLTDSIDGAPVQHAIQDAPNNAEVASPSRAVFRLKAGTKSLVWLRASGNDATAYVNIATGEILSTAGAGFVSLDPGTDLGGGWFEFTIHTSISGGAYSVYIAESDGDTTYQGDGTGTIFMYAPEFHQRRVLLEKDQSRALTTILSNGDFETGSPPSDWNGVGGGVLTARAGARTGGSGSQYVRATIPIADSIGSCDQPLVLTSGAVYCVSGWARGDGVNGYPVFGDSGGDHWVGTTSNDWQYFNVVITAGGTTFKCKVYGNNATEDYAEYDDVSCVVSNDTYQETGSDQPIYWTTTPTEAAYLQFQDLGGGTGSHQEWVVPDATEGTIWCWVRRNRTASNETIVGSKDALANWMLLRFIGGADTIDFYVGTIGHTHTVSVPADVWTFVACTYSSTAITITVNGSTQSFAAGGTPSTLALTIGKRDNVGVLEYTFDGDIGDIGILNRALSATEIADIRAGTLRT